MVRLTDVNELFLREISAFLGLKTKIKRDNQYPRHGVVTERLLAIAKATGATSYLSGPSAKTLFSRVAIYQRGHTAGVDDMSNTHNSMAISNTPFRSSA